jgi:hypothetical protein
VGFHIVVEILSSIRELSITAAFHGPKRFYS